MSIPLHRELLDYIQEIYTRRVFAGPSTAGIRIVSLATEAICRWRTTQFVMLRSNSSSVSVMA